MNDVAILTASLGLFVVAGCSPAKSEAAEILLYCDGTSDYEIKFDDNGEPMGGFEAIRGYIRIDPQENVVERLLIGDDEFSDLCFGGCTLSLADREITYANTQPRQWRGKSITDRFVFERMTGHFYRETTVEEKGELERSHLRGTCQPIEDMETRLF